MKIFKDMIPGTDVSRIIMENGAGVLVELISNGAAIRRVAVKNGDRYDTLTLSFTDYNDYIVKNSGYVGKTLAPCAGRIPTEEGLPLPDGSAIHPEANENNFCSLHGSKISGCTENWTVTAAELRDGKAAAEFKLSQPDGLCGWPGNRDYTVLYTLDEDGALRIDYHAESDRLTYINMSNHAYWNLNLVPEKAMEQRIKVNAEGFVCNTDMAIPYKILTAKEVEETDGIVFSAENELSVLAPMHGNTEYSHQIQLGHGVDNAFSFGPHSLDDCLCELSDSEHKHTLKMYSDAPAMVTYTSGTMGKGHALEDGYETCRSCSIALEFEEMGTVQAPTFTAPGKPFDRVIIFRIS